MSKPKKKSGGKWVPDFAGANRPFLEQVEKRQSGGRRQGKAIKKMGNDSKRVSDEYVKTLKRKEQEARKAREEIVRSLKREGRKK